jgi:ribonuclease BN (tRNA processing enzyme)
MKYLFRAFKSGSGDCIFLLLYNNGQEVHVMVDCGKYEPEIDEFIESKCNCVLDYLIVTHIDNDHINGLITMLSKKKDLTIRHILYNCYQRTSSNLEQWDSRMRRSVSNIYGNLPVVVDLIEQKISENAAVTLAENILNNENWKNAWRRDYITDDTAPIDLGNDIGRFVFLSPSQQSLDSLDIKYRKMFWTHLYKQKDSDFDKEENIYEALMRIANMEESEETEEYEISDSKLDEQKLRYYALEELDRMTTSNQTSIAFIWEHREHRILFLGDADPMQICNTLGIVYRDMSKPILFDVIKVSHHGSAHSTSIELMAMADSERFFFTGGTSMAPSIQTLSRIVTAKLPDDISKREIIYNRGNAILTSLEGISTELRDRLRFSVSNEKNSYEISY